jgi:glutaredoxin
MSSKNENLLATSFSSSSSSSISPQNDGNIFWKFFSMMYEDAISYISEYGLKFGDSNGTKLKENQIVSLINDYDIVIITTEGCGFCESAKEMLRERNAVTPFTQTNINGTDYDTINAMKNLFNLSDVTFPQIVIQGVYISGCDSLREIIRLGNFDKLLLGQKIIAMHDHPIDWYPPLLLESQTPNIFLNPSRKSSWYCFHLFMYSNLIRYISIIQLLAMIAALLLLSTNNSKHEYAFAKLILSIMCIDLAILCLHGASPFSPSGTFR